MACRKAGLYWQIHVGKTFHPTFLAEISSTNFSSSFEPGTSGWKDWIHPPCQTELKLLMIEKKFIQRENDFWPWWRHLLFIFAAVKLFLPESDLKNVFLFEAEWSCNVYMLKGIRSTYQHQVVDSNPGSFGCVH